MSLSVRDRQIDTLARCDSPTTGRSQARVGSPARDEIAEEIRTMLLRDDSRAKI
jgi:hypothetical protein